VQHGFEEGRKSYKPISSRYYGTVQTISADIAKRLAGTILRTNPETDLGSSRAKLNDVTVLKDDFRDHALIDKGPTALVRKDILTVLKADLGMEGSYERITLWIKTEITFLP